MQNLSCLVREISYVMEQIRTLEILRMFNDLKETALQVNTGRIVHWKQTTPSKKWGEKINRNFFEVEIQIAKMHVKISNITYLGNANQSNSELSPHHNQNDLTLINNIFWWLTLVKTAITSAGVYVGKKWPSSFAGGNIDWLRKSLEDCGPFPQN